MPEQLFTKKMRAATRDVHAISDGLVNAKLAFALSDNSVWADGLLVFYEIFNYLEEAMNRLRHTPIGLLKIEGLDRTEAFEKDLTFYLGNDWKKTYTPRPDGWNPPVCIPLATPPILRAESSTHHQRVQYIFLYLNVGNSVAIPQFMHKIQKSLYGTVRFTVPATWCLTVVRTHTHTPDMLVLDDC
uniref:Uncharacterized protein n=1 Tax=Timema monikensis TaxID=170555 RepID=A0A7R9E1F6_9NEOP|nr:unnamed protein product [Timema monikensis]